MTDRRQTDPAKAPRDVPVVRSAILGHYAALAASMGVDIIAMLGRSGVDRRCLADPDMRVPIDRAAALVAISADAARCDTFGIRLTLGRGTPDLGPLNLLLREEPDLRSALGSLQGYLHVHSDGVALRLDEGEDTAVLRVGLRTAAPRRQATEMVACGVLQTLCWLTGATPDSFLLCFTHAAPADISAHRALLGCPVQFDSAIDGIVLAAADLSRPIPQASSALRRHAEEYVRSLPGRLPQSPDERVRRLIAALLPTGGCSARSVSAELGIDRTTMARRLARCGTSYEQLVLDVRRDAAIQACRGDAPLKRIAERLGYADLSSFSRWFTHSFGCAPSAWRAREGINATRAPTAPSA